MYSNLKQKQKNYITELAYEDILEQIIAGMFDFKGFPATVNTDFIPIYRMREGVCAFIDFEGIQAVGHAAIGGKPGYNGIGEDVIVSLDNGWVHEFKDWRTNPNVAIMYNDIMMRPDLNIGRFADMLTKLDISLNLNVLYSRLFPIPTAHNEDDKKALDEIITAILKGDQLRAMLNSDIMSEIISGKKGVDLVSLTDVTTADKIQYLLKAHDDIMRRFYGLYGMDVNGTEKMAQQSVAEVGSRQGASMILPYNMFKSAQAGVEMINDKFGWGVSVKFSRPWQYDLNNDGVLDVLQDDAEQGAPEDQTEDEEEQDDAES